MEQLPLDVWCHITSFLETPQELGAVSSALNLCARLFVRESMPHHLRHNIIPLAAQHDRSDVFKSAVGYGFSDDFYSRLLFLNYWKAETKELKASHARYFRKICAWKRMWWYEARIHWAVEEGWLDIVKWFYSQGCPLVRQDKKLNIMDLPVYAARRGHFDMVLWLIQHGCPCKAMIYGYAQALKKKRITDWFERKEVMGDFLVQNDYMKKLPEHEDEYTIPLEVLKKRGAFDQVY